MLFTGPVNPHKQAMPPQRKELYKGQDPMLGGATLGCCKAVLSGGRRMEGVTEYILQGEVGLQLSGPDGPRFNYFLVMAVGRELPGNSCVSQLETRFWSWAPCCVEPCLPEERSTIVTSFLSMALYELQDLCKANDSPVPKTTKTLLV